MRSWSRFASAVLCGTIAWGNGSALAADPSAADPQGTASLGMELTPTASCPQEAIAELNKAIDFVRGQTWADQPGSHPLTIAPDLEVCRVVLHVGGLTQEEEAALQAGAGSRLAIEYRRDWATPSPLLLILWIVFGGSGVVWVYRRFGRR